MNRLTKKDIEGAYDFTYSNGEFVRGICPLGEHPNQEIYSNGLNKLGKLEDIEEQLGCPLEVVFKAINDGAYFKTDYYGMDITYHILENHEIDFKNARFNIRKNNLLDNKPYYTGGFIFNWKDYKKTWWLKNDTAEEDTVRLMTQLCKTSSDLRVFHLEPAAEVTEEAKHLLDELKGKINCKPFNITESIDTSLKENNDQFCLNLTTIQPPHSGGGD